MKVLFIILGCWISVCVSAIRTNPNSPKHVNSVLEYAPLYRRTDTRESSPSWSVSRPPRVHAHVTATAKEQPFTGTTFIKNSYGKTARTEGLAGYQAGWSHSKVSSGGIQQHDGEITAESRGRNVGVKLVVPEGSKGTYYTAGSTSQQEHTVDHTQSPFKKTFPPNPDGSQTSAIARIQGPGKVKAKAWNEI